MLDRLGGRLDDARVSLDLSRCRGVNPSDVLGILGGYPGVAPPVANWQRRDGTQVRTVDVEGVLRGLNVSLAVRVLRELLGNAITTLGNWPSCSVANKSMAFCRAARSVSSAASLAPREPRLRRGRAMAANTARMAATMTNSIRLNPFSCIGSERTDSLNLPPVRQAPNAQRLRKYRHL